MKKATIFCFLLISFFIFGCSQQVSQEPASGKIMEVPAPGEKDVKEMVVANEGSEIAEPAEGEKQTIPETFEVKTKGLTFFPDILSIKKGDQVKFVLGSSHNVAQVEKETWDANLKNPLQDGFKVGFGETKEVTFDQPGTYYYVCQPHASLNMKGIIVVE